MELDDLRRQWRQPEPAPLPTLTAPQLDALLKGRTLGLVEKMRRAAWLETAGNASVGLGMVAFLLYTHDRFVQLAASLLLVVVAISSGYYYQVLGVLRRMAEPTGSVRGHLVTLNQGMRHLLRFYYRFSVATGLVTTVVLYGFMLWQFGNQGKLRHWPTAALIVALFVLAGALTQVVVVRFTRQYVQRLYGQHLDRLEGQLRELSEGELAA